MSIDAKLVPIFERALGLPTGIVERDAEWGNAMPGSGPIWTHDQLVEAYLLAGMDRRALLVRVGLVERVAVTVTTQPSPETADPA